MHDAVESYQLKVGGCSRVESKFFHTTTSLPGDLEDGDVRGKEDSEVHQEQVKQPTL